MQINDDNNNFEYYKIPSVDSWLLMGSPVYIILIILMYLYFVLKLGPQLMENGRPFELKYVLMTYNSYQVIFSSWLCIQIFLNEDVWTLMVTCVPTKEKHLEIGQRFIWWYFISKIIELLDTVFFVLRKKQSQVTFLHIYHHTLLPSFCWILLKYLPLTHSLVYGLINSFVHVVMYSYYLLAGLGPKYQKYLWWKKYVTKLQLLQFVIGLMLVVYQTTYACSLPTYLVWFYVFNGFFFLFLFGNFYVKAYYKIKVDVAKQDKVK